jgi:hypothetical protein
MAYLIGTTYQRVMSWHASAMRMLMASAYALVKLLP